MVRDVQQNFKRNKTKWWTSQCELQPTPAVSYCRLDDTLTVPPLGLEYEQYGAD